MINQSINQSQNHKSIETHCNKKYTNFKRDIDHSSVTPVADPSPANMERST